MAAKSTKKSRAGAPDLPPGKYFRAISNDELLADMCAFGREVGRSKATAQAFLQEAGIITRSGKLAKPYRAK
ncbi:hypothetical protein [Bordetella genomosp. 1]|uniref:DNA-binding protein n=1 Tax=Bordetella genomosp. 1 TaxID=1395607 RepID=A0ABX4F5H0_9BORD|nr:hypothetical protein [Bordetella genomosp. 1]OZI68076.1 hypothetical protein CAL27_00980 [Bordetella genomosp. 1]